MMLTPLFYLILFTNSTQNEVKIAFLKNRLTNILSFDIIIFANATMAQLVEHILGKDEVIGSIPISSSKKTS